ncbi:Elongator complex protein 5 [Dendrobium catenatum]|uniref:Elongator complex protein 5 n=1 Tax=Dendrobium catenatum TaxID=906689 RepID=A0A2I0VRT9_9ASPA|nr:Elongator complex protein 5 [Dendrobium catenatum]
MAESICRSLRDGSIEGEHSPALTIKDSLQSHAGTHAFNYFLCSLAANVCAGKSQARGLVLVAFSQSPSFYLSLLKRKRMDASLLTKCLRILDCYSDPLGWKEKIRQSSGPDKPVFTESDYVCRDVKDITKLLSSILELGKGFSEGRAYFAVAIDSVSQVSSMLWLLHADLHEPRSTAVLEYMSSIVASVEPMVEITDGQKGSDNLFWLGRGLQKGRFHVRFKRRNGRVKLFLQFNLQLSEKERADRSRVLLPFEHQGNGEPIQIYDGRRSLTESNTGLNGLQQHALSIEMEAQRMQSKEYSLSFETPRSPPSALAELIALGLLRAPMADTNSSLSPSPDTRSSASPKRDDLRPMGIKIAELNESQSELLNRLQGLKQLEDLSEPSKEPEDKDNANASNKAEPSLPEITEETSPVDASA